ncbi:MAG: type II toxin-antitoxin system HipA family toxin [Opitutaceae bacterium]|nr:type II toxin-antitoxin system HipA family toxin [Opitutaceae bacterium]
MANTFVNRQPVGTLSREDPLNRFAYEADVPPSLGVSLLMPVAAGPYGAERSGVLHPVFDMSLPEGALRDAVSNLFAKALPAIDDLALFQIVGRSLIGRIRFGESAAQLDQVPTHNLRDLLKTRGTGELFAELLTRYAQYSGVAGIQPKVLVRDDGGLRTENFSPVETGERLTAHGTTHIVKSFDPARYPGLAANEYLCLRAAAAAGLAVGKTSIATDGRLLVVERFDLKADGSYLAFEDGCALAGRLSREKYEGSYEQLVGTLANVLRGPDGTGAELAKFFRSFVLSVAVRNGDAHRKNFGVIYDDATGHVTLAPTFDVITTTPYLPNDSLALTLDGTKRWPDAKRLVKFGIRYCGLTTHVAKSILSEVAEAVATVSKDLAQFSDLDPDAEETPARMKSAWAQGVAALALSA